MSDFNPKRGFHEQTPEQNQHRLKLFLNEHPLRLEKIREVVQRLDSARVGEEFEAITRKFLNFPSAYRQDALRFLSNIQPIESTLPIAVKDKLSAVKEVFGWQPGIELREFDDGRAESAKDPVHKLIRLLNERHLRFGMIGEVFGDMEDKDERAMYQALHSRAHQLLRECIPSDGKILPEKVKELAEFVEGMTHITLSMWDDEWQIIEAINHYAVVRLSSMGQFGRLDDYRKIVGTSIAEAAENRKANDANEPVALRVDAQPEKKEVDQDPFRKETFSGGDPYAKFRIYMHEQPYRPELIKELFASDGGVIIEKYKQKAAVYRQEIRDNPLAYKYFVKDILDLGDDLPPDFRKILRADLAEAQGAVDSEMRQAVARHEPIPEPKVEVSEEESKDQQKMKLMGQLRGGSFAYANRQVVDRYGADCYKDPELKAAAKDGLIRLKAEGNVSEALLSSFASRWAIDEKELKKSTKKRTKKQ